MEGAWRMHGGCIEDAWRVQGGSMEEAWRVHGGCVCYVRSYRRALFHSGASGLFRWAS